MPVRGHPPMQAVVRITTVIVACAVLATAASPALANVYYPSFVQIVAQPLLWSMYVVTCVVTVPVLLAIAAIEAAVIRRTLPERPRLRSLLRGLFVINALTSLAGFAMPYGTEVIPGIFIAYAITVPLEAVGLWRILRLRTSLRGARTWLSMSARMNLFSYSALGLTLVALGFDPDRLVDSPGVRQLAHGAIVLQFFGDAAHVVDLDADPPTVRRIDLGRSGSPDLQPGPTITQADDGEIELWTIGRTGLAAVPSRLRFPLEAVAAVSPDLRLALVATGEKWAVFAGDSGAKVLDARVPTGFAAFSGGLTSDGAFALGSVPGSPRDKTEWHKAVVDLRTAAAQVVEFDDEFAVSPKTPSVAWIDDGAVTVYDCSNGRARRVPAHGASYQRRLAWSPDGKLLAYAGCANPFRSNVWFRDIRVVDVATGRSTTVAQHLFTSGAGQRLYWVR